LEQFGSSWSEGILRERGSWKPRNGMTRIGVRIVGGSCRPSHESSCPFILWYNVLLKVIQGLVSCRGTGATTTPRTCRAHRPCTHAAARVGGAENHPRRRRRPCLPQSMHDTAVAAAVAESPTRGAAAGRRPCDGARGGHGNRRRRPCKSRGGRTAVPVASSPPRAVTLSPESTGAAHR